MDLVNVLHTYINKIRAFIGTQIQNWGVKGGNKALISQDFIYKNVSHRKFYFCF